MFGSETITKPTLNAHLKKEKVSQLQLDEPEPLPV